MTCAKEMTYKDVINEFKEKCNRYCLSDEYLKSIDNTTRKDAVLCGEYEYGMVYLRDDAVKLLIDKINELEQKG